MHATASVDAEKLTACTRVGAGAADDGNHAARSTLEESVRQGVLGNARRTSP